MTPERSSSSLRVAAMLLLLLALVPSALSLSTKRQLFALGGLTDNWIYLGANLRVAGVLGEGDMPMVLRAPGYPAFVAGVLALGLEKPPAVTHEYMVRGAEAVYAAQALLLASTGVLLFLWLADLTSRVTAFAAALSFATSAHALVLVGLLHYSVVHLALLVAGGLALHRLLRAERPTGRAALLTGLLWGVATLVRSTTLILPVFVLGLCWLRFRDLRRACLVTLVFAVGMGVAIAPVAIRNFTVAHRFVAVNLQAGAAVWGSTVKPLPPDPNAYRWFDLSGEFMRIYSRVTGRAEYDYAVFARHHLAIEDELWRDALSNLKRDPRPYVLNGLRTFESLCLDTSSILIRMFRFSQPPGPWIDQQWFHASVPRDFLPAVPAAGYAQLGAALTALAAIGVAIALREMNTLALVPVALFGCLAIAHALTYMDVLYYYVRLPFVAFMAFYGVEGLARLVPEAGRSRALALSRFAALALCGASLLLTAQMLAG